MVKHIVMWKLKDEAEGGTRESNARRMKRMLEVLPSTVPGIRRLEVGIDFLRGEGSFDVVLTVEFDDKAALDAYQRHPEHAKVAEFIGKVRGLRAVADYLI